MTRPILALAALAAAAFVLTVKAAGGVNRAVGRRWEWEDEPMETAEDRDWLVPGAAWPHPNLGTWDLYRGAVTSNAHALWKEPLQ